MATAVYGSVRLRAKGKLKGPIPERVKRLKKQATWKSRGINLTLPEYDEMVSAQGGVCKICSKHPGSRDLAVDHDHKTGKVRGLLCWRCNYYLVRRGITSEMLRRASEYLSGTL